MRRLVAGIILVAVIGIFGYFFARSVYHNDLRIDPADAFPDDAALYFKFPGSPLELSSRIATHSYSQDLLGEDQLLGMIYHQSLYLDSLFSSGDDIPLNWSKGPVFAGVGRVSVKDIDLIYWFQSDFTPSEFEDWVKSGLGAETAVSKRVFRNQEIWEWEIKDHTWAITELQGLIVVSHSPFLLDELVDQLEDEEHLDQNSPLRELLVEAEDNPRTCIYFNPAQVDQLLEMQYGDAGFFGLEIDSLLSWCYLEIHPVADGLDLKGLALADESYSLTKNRFSAASGESDALLASLPEIVAGFMIFSDENATDIPEWAGNSWAAGILESYSDEYKQNQFVAVLVADESEVLDAMTSGTATEPIVYRGKEVYPIAELLDLDQVFAPFFPSWNSGYAILTDGVLIMTSSLDAMRHWLDAIAYDRYLSRNIEYARISDKLASKSNCFIYANTDAMQPVLGKILSGNGSMAEDFSPWLIQLTAFKDRFLINAHIHGGSGGNSGTAPIVSGDIWTYSPEAQLYTRPYAVLNHYTGETELIFQDQNKNLILMDKSGKELWSRELDMAILGDIHMIDLYNNDKYQYLFNTANKIYVIDREGNDVSPYPLTLNKTATAGLALVDYDNDNDYRIFVSTDDKSIYGYRKNGEPLPGWSPRKKLGNIEQTLKFFAFSGKDYLIIHNTSGELEVLNRKGEERLKTVKLKTYFPDQFRVEIVGDDFQFWNVDSSGVLYRITTDGKDHIVELEDLQEVSAYRLLLMSDGSIYHIVIDKKGLHCFDKAGTRVFTFHSQGLDPASLELYSRDLYEIAVSNPLEKHHYLINAQGEMHPDFPITGEGRFSLVDLFGSGKVFVGGEEGVLTTKSLQ